MKNTILLASAILLFGTTMVSCKKDYICNCSKTYTSGSGGTNSSNYSTYTYKENAKRADDRCAENETSASDVWGNYSINCEIK